MNALSENQDDLQALATEQLCGAINLWGESSEASDFYSFGC